MIVAGPRPALGRGALALFALSLAAAVGPSCTSDNSVGPDVVPGNGQGTGGGSASGSGGAPLPPQGSGGSGGSVIAPGSGGTGGGVSPTSSGGSGAGGNSRGNPDAGSDTRPAAGGTGVGAGNDGGTTTGAIAAGGASKCAESTAKLCDGFEGPAIGATGSAWKAEVVGTSAAVVDTTKPYRGTKSAHLTFAAAQAFITQTQTFTAGGTAAVNNDMWGRMFVWYEFSAGTANGHFVFIRAEGTVAAGAPAASAQLHVAGGYQMKFASEIRTTTDLYKYATPTIAIPQVPAHWQCWEWHTTGTTLDFYIDGKVVPGMSVTGTEATKWPFPNFNKLYLGFLQFSASPTGQMWIDEVAVGGTQIGCDN